ncbi:hypothetical protein PICMEDRAFT_15263 [Pichia membranifaciens NRRL Y-2026]|uniref:Uncharacterized protein n=1 Tax=Pichia membranifaciens NRRL Y-2026 TaxID=763406 RepID=A0A1E3NNN3_9ASCO|nr:hypothetical protein PICMEDRAFT_15263 [Pichia membranifaciens NRRL Y-2026]ODQ47288.1 hypothetical protein PICMEDRAFT_15263 [Pichia membranifaciens NRRL Y-2026]
MVSCNERTSHDLLHIRSATDISEMHDFENSPFFFVKKRLKSNRKCILTSRPDLDLPDLVLFSTQ